MPNARSSSSRLCWAESVESIWRVGRVRTLTSGDNSALALEPSWMTCRSGRGAALKRGSAYYLHIRLKAKHSKTDTFRVAGWRPSTPSRPGGLILVEGDGPIAVATLALADKDRQDLVDLLHRWGRRHPTGAITIPPDCLTAPVRYTSCTPTHGHLREASLMAVQPAGQQPMPRLGLEKREVDPGVVEV